MKDTLYIHLDGPPETPKAWLAERGGTTERGSDPLAEIAARSRGARVLVLVPGTEVLLASVAVPTRKRSRLLQALPYALEDRLAGDVETLHFALGAIEADGTAHAAVVARETMARWLAELAEAGIAPDALYPETLAVPLEENGWSLLLTADRALLRSGPYAAVATETESLDALLQLALEGPAAPERIRLFDARGDGPSLVPPIEGSEVIREALPDPLPLLARGIKEREPVDLLQGEYGRREALGRRWRPWRPAAVLAALILLLQGALSVQQAWVLGREEARLNARIEQLYRQTFPEAQRVVAPRRQMEQQLEALRRGGGGDAFAALLGEVGPLLKGTSGVQLKGLNFRNDQLEIELTARNLQGLDHLQRRLAAEGLQVEVAGANASGDRVEGRLTVKRGSA